MANLITGIRIIGALGLLFCPPFSIWFYVIYIVCGISDVLDGIVARRSHQATPFGARFDTIADTLFVVVTIIKVLPALYIPLWLIVWTVCIAAIKCVNIFSGFVLYGRFVAVHSVMNKICGILLFAIPLCGGWLSPKPTVVLIALTCSVATFSAIQEGHDIRTGKEIY